MKTKNYIKEWDKVMVPDWLGNYELALILTQEEEIKFPTSKVRVHLLADSKEEWVSYKDIRKVNQKLLAEWNKHRKHIEDPDFQ